METLDVPEVKEVPVLSSGEDSPVGFADMVLTTLLGFDTALLCAEHSFSVPDQAPVGWFVHPIEAGSYSRGIEIASSPSRGYFRTVLARFGAHYMTSGQLYGGYTLRLLRQRGRVHRCHIYTSNNGQSGFWIRVYATVV